MEDVCLTVIGIRKLQLIDRVRCSCRCTDLFDRFRFPLLDLLMTTRLPSRLMEPGLIRIGIRIIAIEFFVC